MSSETWLTIAELTLIIALGGGCLFIFTLLFHDYVWNPFMRKWGGRGNE